MRLEVLDDGALWCLVLATPKANVIDAAKIAAQAEQITASVAAGAVFLTIGGLVVAMYLPIFKMGEVVS